MRKTVSLAMTTYNGEKYLREQLDSIYNQTRVPDEVIVCDDNSSDKTISILEEYSKSKGLKYYKNNPGLGVNKNFFKAISLCSGDYISLCDQDDIWLPNKIETLFRKISEIDNGQPCAVSSQCDNIDGVGNIINRNTAKDTSGYAATLLYKGVSQGCTMMINRCLAEMALEFSSNVKYEGMIYDALIAYCAAIFGEKYNLGQSLMLYRHHNSNVMGNIDAFSSPIKTKINMPDTFVGFIHDVRIKDLSLIFNSCKSKITNKSIYTLLSTINEINSHNNLFVKLMKVFEIREYSLSQRLTIVVKTLGLKLLRIYYRFFSNKSSSLNIF